ncbi:DUF2878 domain-containing protein [Paraglaciecola algarum]|uniref:DUF2878 domain-containing protein n=1 Tax=Paraglaciecola algarum TaxID=3050085 RepID=UPI0032EA466B
MLINLIGFQICWLGLVYFGNFFSPVAILLVCIHIHKQLNRWQEFKLILSTLCIGIVIDGLLTINNVFIFTTSAFIPFWLIMLWACFAATLSHSLKILKHSILLQALVGAVIAPFSYIAGHKLGAVEFTYSLLITYLILSLIWGPLLVLLFRLEKWFTENKRNVL